MIFRVIALVALLASPAVAEPRWMIVLDATSTLDRAWMSDRGPVSLRGSGAALHLALARRVRPQWFVHVGLSASTIGNLDRSAGEDARSLPDGQLLHGALGVGLTWRQSERWWLAATLSPTIAAYISPRVIGLTAIGIVGEVVAARAFQLTQAWSIDVVGRATLAGFPDQAQRWTFASLGLGLAARAAW